MFGPPQTSNNESFTPEILPINGPALCEKMAIGQRNEKAFGPKMDTLLRMQAAYDIAQARDKQDQIKVKRYVEAPTNPA